MRRNRTKERRPESPPRCRAPPVRSHAEGCLRRHVSRREHRFHRWSAQPRRPPTRVGDRSRDRRRRHLETIPPHNLETGNRPSSSASINRRSRSSLVPSCHPVGNREHRGVSKPRLLRLFETRAHVGDDHPLVDCLCHVVHRQGGDRCRPRAPPSRPRSGPLSPPQLSSPRIRLPTSRVDVDGCQRERMTKRDQLGIAVFCSHDAGELRRRERIALRQGAPKPFAVADSHYDGWPEPSTGRRESGFGPTSTIRTPPASSTCERSLIGRRNATRAVEVGQLRADPALEIVLPGPGR